MIRIECSTHFYIHFGHELRTKSLFFEIEITFKFFSNNPKSKTNLKRFKKKQLDTVNNAVAMAEELVSNAYKMSENQWLRRRYDVSTLAELKNDEIVDGPFAQVIRFSGRLKGSYLGSAAYDYYKICLQDHFILDALQQSPEMQLFPLILYIATHELIHIVRFSKFLQNFDASAEEILSEEKRVHAKTRDILAPVRMDGLSDVFDFYRKWHHPFEDLRNS